MWGVGVRRELLVLPLLSHSLRHTHTHRQSAGSASCKSASPHSSRERGDGRDGKEKINQAKRACCCLWSQPPLSSPSSSPSLQLCHLLLSSAVAYKYLYSGYSYSFCLTHTRAADECSSCCLVWAEQIYTEIRCSTFSSEESLYKPRFGQVTPSAPKLFALLSLLRWSLFSDFLSFPRPCFVIFLSFFLIQTHCLFSHFPFSSLSVCTLFKYVSHFTPLSGSLSLGGSSRRFFPQLLFLAESQPGSRGPLAAAQGFVRNGERRQERGGGQRRRERRGLKRQEMTYMQGKRKAEEREKEEMAGEEKSTVERMQRLLYLSELTVCPLFSRWSLHVQLHVTVWAQALFALFWPPHTIMFHSVELKRFSSSFNTFYAKLIL